MALLNPPQILPNVAVVLFGDCSGSPMVRAHTGGSREDRGAGGPARAAKALLLVPGRRAWTTP